MAQVHQLSSTQLEIAHFVESLKVTITHLDHRISLWETNYLPAIFERMAELNPPLETDTEEEPQHQSEPVPRQQQRQEVEVQTQASPQEVTSPEQSEPPPHHIGSTANPPTIMELLRQQSTRAVAAATANPDLSAGR